MVVVHFEDLWLCFLDGRLDGSDNFGYRMSCDPMWVEFGHVARSNGHYGMSEMNKEVASALNLVLCYQ